jgi:hypothetical protein
MYAIVFFCFRPPKAIFDFAKLLNNKKYDIFVSINDNNYKIPEYDNNKITIIKLDEIIVKNAGYFNSNHNMRYQVSSRDKAFYYFNKINHTNYKHIWFIEEDVFIPTTKTISNIDKKYPKGDYMSNSYYILDNDRNNLNNFNNINKNLPFVQYVNNYRFYESWAFKDHNVKNYFKFPWLKCMTCAIRVSKKFLNIIDIFIYNHKKLIIDEILYPTLSLHNNLSIINPIELSTIVYRCDIITDKITQSFYWNLKDIRSDYLFHPIKTLCYIITDKITQSFYWNLKDIRSDYLYHPIKDLNLQNELRIKHKFN